MEVLVRNAEGNVSTHHREYAAKKLGKLDRYFQSAQRVEMVHREEKNGHRIEITVFADGYTVRGEEHDIDLHAAIDRVSDKLEGRLKKLKGRLADAQRKRGNHQLPPALEEPVEDGPTHVEIKERKQFLLKPMSRDEASLQMEMVDHPFYIFKNEDTQGVEVLYKRKDGKYGLLQPEI